MRALAICAFALAAVVSPAAAQTPVADSLLESGTLAKAWSLRYGWFSGTLARLFPPGSVACLGVASDAIGGFAGIARIDSLMLDSSAINRQRVLGRGVPDPQLARWLPVALGPLRARERGCD